jgi:putative peptide zinc metalloprotease protein
MTNRYQAIIVVPDGDGFILGRSAVADFVAVPRIGGQISQWLQSDMSIEDSAARAVEVGGQQIDIAGFLADLEAAGILNDRPPPVVRPPFGCGLGRVLFGRIGLTVQTVLVVVGLVLLVTDPALRPAYRDGVPFAVPLASILIIATLAMVLTIVHELAHKLAAAQLGVHGRISFGRRLFFIVAQTDVTGPWVSPRKKRAIPLVAGILIDAAIVAALLVVRKTWGDQLGSPTTEIIPAAVFGNVGAIVGQTAVYMRTDFYALFLVLTGRKNLWALKGAIVRQLIRRTNAEDDELLAAGGPADIFSARCYLLLYVPGVAIACWYYFAFRLQAAFRLIELSWSEIAAAFLNAIGGVLAILLIIVPTVIGLVGAGRSTVRGIRQLTRPRQETKAG